MFETKLIGEFDAHIWAKEFVKRVKEKPVIAGDIGRMTCWFASAFMAGYDKAKDEDWVIKTAMGA